jgi:hypothetical protein
MESKDRDSDELLDFVKMSEDDIKAIREKKLDIADLSNTMQIMKCLFWRRERNQQRFHESLQKHLFHAHIKNQRTKFEN